MISSLPNQGLPLNCNGRALVSGARGGEQTPAPEAEWNRAVDQAADNKKVGVELSRKEEAGRRDRTHESGAGRWDDDPVEQASRIIADKTKVRAGIAVLKSADRMIGTLLDVVG